MSKLLIVGTVAFDAIETPFGKTDKILGGAGTYIGLSASQFNVDSAVVSIVGDDFPQKYLDLLTKNNINRRRPRRGDRAGRGREPRPRRCPRRAGRGR